MTKPRITKLAAYGKRLGRCVEMIYTSDEAYYNWLSRVTDDNPDYKQADNG
jgi:hypothetical protein